MARVVSRSKPSSCVASSSVRCLTPATTTAAMTCTRTTTATVSTVPKRFESGVSAAAQQKSATELKTDKTDVELLEAVQNGSIKFFDIENHVSEDFERAVHIRRSVVEQKVSSSLDKLPFKDYDYSIVHGQCAENVIGYVPLPVGVAGPINVDGKEYHVPLATTEGALVASTTRGCKAITMSGGASTEVYRDGISRAPVVQVANARVAAQLQQYITENFDDVAAAFNSTSRFARVQDIKVFIAGRLVFLRFKAGTGDAMGMNMVSKGVEKALDYLSGKFPMDILSLSGNVCTDKKPSAVNWIEGRGKSVVCDAVIKGEIIEKVLKSTVADMVHLNYAKNMVGSAVAGSIGGFNAHAANIVTAAYLATGQDPAQNVESSTCMTTMEATNDGKDLYVSVNMPSLEVGTIGGGTILPGQSACLEMLGVKGSNNEEPGANAKQLARVISATVLAGELSLMAALSAGHLIRAHIALNRKPAEKK
jgi:hydroxymethylglutaryl-CoA reductase (NADPH)